MKKLFLPLIMFLFIPLVYGMELTELDNYEIKYKFYKESIDSMYYPKGLFLEGYEEDTDNIKYSEYSDWQNECEINDNREIEYQKKYTYNEIKKVASIKLYNFSVERDQSGIIIYNGNKKIDYQNVSTTWPEIKLKLDDYYNPSDLLIYAFFLNRGDFSIMMYSDFDFKEPILAKRIIKSNFYNIVVDSKFDTLPSSFVEKTYDIELEDNFFRKKISETTKCRYRNILTYRYKVNREYYDNNYYDNIPGYKKDYEDFKIYYQKENNYIEVLKIDKEYITVPEYKYFEIPKYEYIEVPKYEYIEKEVFTQSEPIPIVKKEYVKEEIVAKENKSSKYIFIIIILILLIVIYKLIKKCRTN